MSATAFIDKMYLLHQRAKKYSTITACPFVFTVTPERVNLGCKFLTFKKMEIATEFGKQHPMCTEPSIVNAYATDSGEIISCKGCIHDKPNA